MQGVSASDGRPIDWGKTAQDYARYRPGPPLSFYHRLSGFGIGHSGQKLLDLATGTGVIARQMAAQGCQVTASDIAEDQVAMASALAKQQGLTIDFSVNPAEHCDYPTDTFDVITANQCFLYLDASTLMPLILKWLKPDGVLVISHFSWLPRIDKIAQASEALILEHNPNWSASDYSGHTAPAYPGLDRWMHYNGYFYYDEAIAFSRADWCGRIRASRGIGASLTEAVVATFDAAHDGLLRKIAGDTFTVTHRIDAHILRVGTSGGD